MSTGPLGSSSGAAIATRVHLPPPADPPPPTDCRPCPCRFNKREQDFATKQEFDDYLEEREDISEPSDAALLSLLPRSAARLCRSFDWVLRPGRRPTRSPNQPSAPPPLQSSTLWRVSM